MQNPISFHKGGKHECYKGWSIVIGPLLPSHFSVFLSSTFFFSAVSISWGYHDKFKTWWLKIVEMDSVMVLEAKNPKVILLGWNCGVGRVTLLVETRGAVGGTCSWPLPGFGGSAFKADIVKSLCSVFTWSSPVFVHWISFYPFLVRMLMSAFRAHGVIQAFSSHNFNLITEAKKTKQNNKNKPGNIYSF